MFDRNDIWVGTRQNGLVHFDIKTKNFKVYTESSGLPNNTIRSIVPDKIGHILGEY